jgi:hypothetical protein
MTNNNFFKTCKHLVIVALSIIPALAGAATQGTPGASSTGSLNVFIKVGSEVRISGLTDYTNENWDGSAYNFETKPFCVYSNGSGGLYGMKITGTDQQPKFELVNQLDKSHPIPMQVEFQDLSVGGNGYAPAVAGQNLPDRVGSTDAACKGQPDARLKISVGAANGLSGKYTGTVYLTVTAQ